MKKLVISSLAALVIGAGVLACSGNEKILRRAVHGYLMPPPKHQLVLPEGKRPEDKLFVRDIGSPPAPNELSILTFNVQRFYRRGLVESNLYRLIRDEDPTIVALQELPIGVWEDNPLDNEFAGSNVVFAPFHQVLEPDWPYRYPEYGQATISNHPLENPKVITLPTVNGKSLGKKHLLQRIAVYTEIPLENGKILRFLNVHNESFTWGGRRSRQYAHVLDTLNESAEPGVEYVDAYCGDTNSRGNETGIQLFRDAGFEDIRGKGLDRCLVRGHIDASFEKLPGAGSDHSAFIFRLKF